MATVTPTAADGSVTYEIESSASHLSPPASAAAAAAAATSSSPGASSASAVRPPAQKARSSGSLPVPSSSDSPSSPSSSFYDAASSTSSSLATASAAVSIERSQAQQERALVRSLSGLSVRPTLVKILGEVGSSGAHTGSGSSSNLTPSAAASSSSSTSTSGGSNASSASLLPPTDRDHREKMASALVHVAQLASQSAALVSHLVSSELLRYTRQGLKGAELRGNSVAVRMQSELCKTLCRAYLRQAYADVVSKLVQSKPLDIRSLDHQSGGSGSDMPMAGAHVSDSGGGGGDSPASRRLDDSSDSGGTHSRRQLAHNQHRLRKYTQEAVNRLTSSSTLALIPREVRAMGYRIAMAAREISESSFGPLVAGFIMLRVVNPAFVDPASYGLLPKGVKEVSSSARQNLISVSRILQKLANDTLFTPEDEFHCMNDFLEKNKAKMQAFLLEFCQDPSVGPGEAPWERELYLKRPDTPIHFDSNVTPNMKKLMFLHEFLWLHCPEIIARLQEASRLASMEATGRQQPELDETPCCADAAWLVRTLVMLGSPSNYAALSPATAAAAASSSASSASSASSTSNTSSSSSHSLASASSASSASASASASATASSSTASTLAASAGGSSLFLAAPLLDDTRLPCWLLTHRGSESGGTPSPRVGQSLCRWQSHLVLYGGKGTDGKALPDSCVYLLDTGRPAWLKVECRVGPPARFHHSALVLGNRMLVFGGGTGAGNLDDLWSFDLLHHKWTQVSTALTGKNSQSAGSDPHKKDASLAEQPATATSVTAAPSARFGHSAVPLPSSVVGSGSQAEEEEEGLLLFGGHDGTVMHNDVFGLTLNVASATTTTATPAAGEVALTASWSCLHNGKASSTRLPPGLDVPAPSPRALHSAVVAQQRMWVFGGRSPDGTACGDLHVWDIDACRWIHITTQGTAPVPRWGHQAVIIHDRMMILGGRDATHVFGFEQAHIFDFVSLTWETIQISSPILDPRHGHSAVPYKDVVFVAYGSSLTSPQVEVGEHATTLMELRFELLSAPGQRDPLDTARNMFNNSRMSDVVFLIGGRKIYAHKVILMFKGCEALLDLVGDQPECPITTVSWMRFAQLLLAIYTDGAGCVGLTSLASTLELLYQFGLQTAPLARLIIQKLVHFIVKDAAAVFKIACDLQLRGLKMKCLTYFQHHPEMCLDKTGMSKLPFKYLREVTAVYML